MQLFQENANWLVVHQIYRADHRELSAARPVAANAPFPSVYVCIQTRRCDESKKQGQKEKGSVSLPNYVGLTDKRPIVRAARIII